LENVKVEGVDNKETRADELQKEILSFAYDDGLIRNVCPSVNERSDVLNIKKAILSAMQVSVKELGSRITVDERDILGDCETIYDEMNAFDKHSEGTKLKKTKILSTCRNRIQSNTMIFQNALLNRFLEKSVDFMQNEYSCYQYIDNDGILKSVECRETSQLKQASSESVVSIHLVNVDDEMLSDNKVFKIQSLLRTNEADQTMDDRKSFELLTSLCNSIRHDVLEKAPKYFHMFIESLKGINKEQIEKIVQKSKNGINGCSSRKIDSLINSALLYAGGNGALDYISKQVNTMSVHDPRRDILLTSLPYTSSINENTIIIMNKLMKNLLKPKDMLFISSLIGNYVRKTGETDSPYINQTVNFLANRLANKCFANEAKNEETIVTLKSIANIGYAPSHVVEKLIKCSKSSDTAINIRVAALDALRRVDACNNGYALTSDVNLLLSMLRKKNDESDEIKIAAYKTMMSCSRSFGEEFVVEESRKIMKDENNKRLAHYVYSYLMNIIKSKTPSMSALRLALRNEDLSFFVVDAQETYSKNILYSQYSKALQMGMDFEVDYIFEKGLKSPKSIVLSAIVPIHKQRVQIFEIGLRQESDDESLSKIVELIKAQTFESIFQLMKGSMFGFGADSEIVQSTTTLEKSILKFMDSLSHASFYFNYNENTLMVEDKSYPAKRINKRDTSVMGMRSFFEQLSQKSIAAELKSIFKESTSAVMLLDSSIEMSTVSGLPIVFAAKSSFISTRGDVKDIDSISLFPNTGLGLCISMKTYVNKFEKRGIKWKTHFVSNLDLWLKIGNQNREKSIEFKLPKEKTKLVQYSSFIAIDSDYTEKIISNSYPSEQICSKDYFGIVVCASKSLSISQRQNFDLTLFKANTAIEGWKAAIALPETGNNRFFIHFSTPGSNDYTLVMEVEEKIERQWNKYHLKYKTTKQNLEGVLAFYNENSAKQASLEFTLNGRLHMYQLHHKSSGNRVETVLFTKTPEFGSQQFKSSYAMKETSVDWDMTYEFNENKFKLLHISNSMNNAAKKHFKLTIGEEKLNQWLNINSVIQASNVFLMNTNVELKSIQMTKPISLTVNGVYNRINDLKFTLHELRGDKQLAILKLTEGLFYLEVTTEKLEHKTILDFDSTFARFTTETKKNGNLMIKGTYQRSDSKMKQILIEVPDTFYLNYDVNELNRHQLKVSHNKFKFVHETSYWKKDDSEIDFRSKSLQDENEIHDVKLIGKYESTNKYDVHTSLNVMKRLRINFDAKSSDDSNKVEMEYFDSLFTGKPIKYEVRALRTPLVIPSDEFAKDHIIKGIPSDDKRIVIEYNFNLVRGTFELNGNEIKLLVNEMQRENSADIKYVREFVYKNIDKNNNEFTAKKTDENGLVYFFKRQATPNLRHFEFTCHKKGLKLTLQKGEEKQRSMVLEVFESGPEDGTKVSLNWAPKDDDVVYDLNVADLKNNPLYDVKLKVSELKSYNFKIELESKNHVLKCKSKAELEVKNYDYDLDYDTECESGKKLEIDVKRNVKPKEFSNIFKIKLTGNEEKKFFEIETKAEKSEDGNSASIKSLVKSSDQSLDGSYLDYKRKIISTIDEHKIDIDSEVNLKPIDLKLNLKIAGSALMSGRYIRVPKEIKLDIEATATNKVGEKFIYEFDFESLSHLVHISSILSEEKSGVKKLIHSRTFHHDSENKVTYFDGRYTPAEAMFNISQIHDKDTTLIIVYGSHKIIDLKVEKTENGPRSKTLKTEGSILGFKVKEIYVHDENKQTTEFELFPVSKEYPFQIPHSLRISDCYESSEEACLSYKSVFDKNHLSSLSGKYKIDEKGNKYTLFIEYEKKVEENKHEKILTIKNNIDDSKLGFYSLKEDIGNEHNCDTKLFLNKGRVIRFKRNSKNAFTGKTEIWLDAERKPEQKLTIEKTLNMKSENDIEFVANVNHPSLKKPVSLKVDLTNGKDLHIIKALLDYSTDSSNKIHFDAELKTESERDDEKRKNTHFALTSLNVKSIKALRLYTEDKKVDITSNEISFTKFTDTETIVTYARQVDWKSMLNPGVLKTDLMKYDVKRIVEDNGIRLTKHFIMKRLSYYFEMDSEVFNSEHEPAINNFDLIFDENGPKYRINSSMKAVEGGECLKLNGFKVVKENVVGPKAYLDICFINSPEKVVEISAGSEDFPKSIDAKIAKKSKDVTLVTVNWNPQRIKSKIIDLLAVADARIKHYKQVMKEMEDERDKMVEALATPMFNDVVQPFSKHVGEQASNIIDENPKLFWPITLFLRHPNRSKRSYRPDWHVQERSHTIHRKPVYIPVKFELISFDASKGELIFEIRH
ncbi:apolipophorins-like protein, partial [Leptotrombidium deliense]